MGNFQPVCDIVLQKFIISVCAMQNFANIVLFSFKLVCNFEIAGSVSCKLYFPSRCSVTASGDVQSASSETIWKC